MPKLQPGLPQRLGTLRAMLLRAEKKVEDIRSEIASIKKRMETAEIPMWTEERKKFLAHWWPSVAMKESILEGLNEFEGPRISMQHIYQQASAMDIKRPVEVKKIAAQQVNARKAEKKRQFALSGGELADWQTVLNYCEAHNFRPRDWDDLPRVNVLRERDGLRPFARDFGKKYRIG